MEEPTASLHGIGQSAMASLPGRKGDVPLVNLLFLWKVQAIFREGVGNNLLTFVVRRE